MANTETGYLRIAVTTAKGSLPIEGAEVRIYSGSDDTVTLIKRLTTDRSGKTELISLPAPPFSLSQSPGSDEIPFAKYIIETDHPGYYTVQNIDAPVYSGVTSIQNVALVPISYGDEIPYDDVRFNESTVPNL
ncbi:MAG: hypothetical protein E7591_07640 [Ruminococcaceae bacterium]|nr:hypothetical protein [Oscillospiraceae bacterium]